MSKKTATTSIGRTATFAIRGVTPLAWSKFVEPKRDDENGKVYEERVWRDKVHVVEGRVAVPALGLRDSFAEGGKDLPIGKGAARAKNLLKTTTLLPGAFYLTNKTLKDLRPEWRMVPSNPGRDSGTRVPKIFPTLDPGWEIEGELLVVDDRITDDLLRAAITKGGLSCGIGALRVQGGGVLGRYALVSLDWK